MQKFKSLSNRVDAMLSQTNENKGYSIFSIEIDGVKHLPCAFTLSEWEVVTKAYYALPVSERPKLDGSFMLMPDPMEADEFEREARIQQTEILAIAAAELAEDEQRRKQPSKSHINRP